MLKKYGEQPEWAGKTPSSFSYYYGIGIINKNVPNFRKIATKSALDNLINEISVNVSSSSLFSTLETNDSFNQEFSQNIHLSSKETIEGYELIDSWENEHQYFVFYQLSRTVHKQLKNKRIKLAVQRSKKTYLAALSLKNTGNYKQALVNEIQALEILNPFLDQDLNTEIDGKEVNLAVQIVHSIKSIENEITITPSFYEKEIKVGKSIDAHDLFVTVTDKKGKLLSNIPVLFIHKAVTSKKRKTNSDEKGIASFDLGKIKSNKGHQVISVNFDFSSIIKEATQNRLIRKIINYQSVSKVQMTLHVEEPTVFIEGKETLNNELSEMQLNIKSKIQKSLLDSKFDIANSEADADLVLIYDIRSSTMIKATPLNIVSTSGTITIYEQNKIIYSHDLSFQKGAHITLNEAVNEAYKKVADQIQKRIIPQFSSQYFNY
ncbi:MAG: hypothetical protein ACJA0Q_000806 [Saprospiraceae bacterium]|jgi:hypothetical protein